MSRWRRFLCWLGLHDDRVHIHGGPGGVSRVAVCRACDRVEGVCGYCGFGGRRRFL